MWSRGVSSRASSCRSDVSFNAADDFLRIVTACVAVGCGVLVLYGWGYGIEALKRIGPAFVAMNPATAVCVSLAGVAIGLNHFGFDRLAVLFGAVVAAVATAKLIDLSFGGLPVDRVLFTDILDLDQGSHPNRMAPNTAAAFLLAGLGLALAPLKASGAQLASQVLAVTVFLISLFAVVGYTFGISHLRAVGPFIPMALHTGVALLVIAVGLLTLSRDRGLMLVLRDGGPAGSMARTVLPLAVLIPISVGAARLWGEQQGYYGTEAGVALVVIANVAATSALLIWSTLGLYRSDCVRKEREQALRESEHFNRTVNEASPDAVSLLDLQGRVVFSNDAALRAYGLTSAAELVGRPWGQLLDATNTTGRDAALATAREGGVGRLTFSLRAGAGDIRWYESLISKLADAEGQQIHFIVMTRDFTEQRRVEDQVRWTATHDALTELPNRSLFQARLEELTQGDEGQGFALLLLDIDDFKRVNDTLGHDAGDALLRTVSERLRGALRPEDFVARLGGDEFAIILSSVRSERALASAGEKILDRLREPWIYDGRLGDCGVSIGARIAFEHTVEPSELLKDADIALYAAKARNRGRLAIFHPAMRAEAQERASKISLAQYALQNDLIVPFYQPKVELASGKVIGFEALLRWRHPTRGIQMPGSIDAAFEDVELARRLTDQILTQVVEDVRGWLDAGIDFGHVAVNAAAADFMQKDFAELLLQRLASRSIPAHRIQVEVTETVFLGRGAEYVEHALKTLSANGVRIALDDFGTGYASLSHLKQFPVDIVKIDRSFLRDLGKDTQNAAIIRTVLSLGWSLGLDVVAEGVEDAEQEAYLVRHGCRFAQGFFYGKAAPAARVGGLLEAAQEKASKAA